MELIVLTAGRATRLGSFAPAGCKALVRVHDRPMLANQLDVVEPDHTTVVCRSAHTRLLYGFDVLALPFDEGGGPARALQACVPLFGRDITGPVVVAYADTWFTELPHGKDWCGTHPAPGGRYWDVADDELLYRYVRPDVTLPVCVGLYRFDDLERLADAIGLATLASTEEVGMGPVVRRYGARFVDVPSWQDVGDPAALVAFKRGVIA